MSVTTADAQIRKSPSDATLQGVHYEPDEKDIVEKERQCFGAVTPPEDDDDEGDFPDGGLKAWMVVLGVRP